MFAAEMKKIWTFQTFLVIIVFSILFFFSFLYQWTKPFQWEGGQPERPAGYPFGVDCPIWEYH